MRFPSQRASRSAPRSGGTLARVHPRRRAAWESCEPEPGFSVIAASRCRDFRPTHRVASARGGGLPIVPEYGTISAVKRRHLKTLDAVFARPISANIQWRDIEALFVELGAEVSEREGSRVAVILFGEVRVFHRPHPNPTTDKGAVASIRKWLEQHGVTP